MEGTAFRYKRTISEKFSKEQKHEKEDKINKMARRIVYKKLIAKCDSQTMGKIIVKKTRMETIKEQSKKVEDKFIKGRKD